MSGTPKVDVRASVYTIEASETLKKQKIIITGGAKGLGYAMAKQFIKDGADVMICGRSVESLESAAIELGCKYLPLDLQNVESFDTFISKADNMLNGVNTLVNNAGISLHEEAYKDVTPKSFEQQFSTNLIGPYFLTQKFIEKLLSHERQGTILMVSSETGETCDFRPYGLSKIALNSLTKGLAHLYKKNGIRINAISPGVTASEMTGFSPDGNLSANNYGSGRIYLPIEVATVASFLISDLAQSLSGQIICCNNANTVNARWK